MLKNSILFLIKIYQKTISPDHGFFPVLRLLGSCRHEPTCSQYTYEAIKEKGALKGLWLGLKEFPLAIHGGEINSPKVQPLGTIKFCHSER